MTYLANEDVNSNFARTENNIYSPIVRLVQFKAVVILILYRNILLFKREQPIRCTGIYKFPGLDEMMFASKEALVLCLSDQKRTVLRKPLQDIVFLMKNTAGVRLKYWQ